MKKLSALLLVVTAMTACKNQTPEETSPEASNPKPQVEVKDLLPETALKHLDSLPIADYNLRQTILPNGNQLGAYLDELQKRSDKKEDRLIFATDTPQEQLSQLIASFLVTADNLADDSKHQSAQGADANEPKQDGLAYNLGSRNHAQRQKMSATNCKLKVYGLDCSGLLYQVFEASKCKGMDLQAIDQSKTSTLNTAIMGVVNNVKAEDKGKLDPTKIISGDIIYWDKIDNQPASHIGICLKSASGNVVFQSNGKGSECEGNLIPARGPRTFGLSDLYWFKANCNWKVLRYEVKP